jgi:hypothetical protein|tara:strand:+ start:310 stop:552 length:243 start_codon:yes stop_codon:yes gene_type:complete
MGFIPALIIGGVISGIIWGMRYMIWKDNVPDSVSSLRWVIAIGIGVLLIFLELNAGFEMKSQSVNGFIIYVIAQALEKEK